MNRPKLQPLPGFFEATIAFFYNVHVRIPALTRFMIKAVDEEEAKKLLEAYFSGREGIWKIEAIRRVQVLRGS